MGKLNEEEQEKLNNIKNKMKSTTPQSLENIKDTENITVFSIKQFIKLQMMMMMMMMMKQQKPLQCKNSIRKN